MKHQYHERDDGLAHCKICGGAEGSLTTECPGYLMKQFEADRVYAEEEDFRDGKWVNTKTNTPTPNPTAKQTTEVALDDATCSRSVLQSLVDAIDQFSGGASMMHPRLTRALTRAKDHLRGMNEREGNHYGPPLFTPNAPFCAKCGHHHELFDECWDHSYSSANVEHVHPLPAWAEGYYRVRFHTIIKCRKHSGW